MTDNNNNTADEGVEKFVEVISSIDLQSSGEISHEDEDYNDMLDSIRERSEQEDGFIAEGVEIIVTKEEDSESELTFWDSRELAERYSDHDLSKILPSQPDE